MPELTQEGLQLVKNEIDTDPAGKGYGAEAATNTALLNEVYGTGVYENVSLNPNEVGLLLLKRNVWLEIGSIADPSGPAADKRAWALMQLVSFSQINIEPEDPDIKGLITGMVSDGTLSSDDATALRDLSRREITESRSGVVIGRNLTIEEVVAAMSL